MTGEIGLLDVVALSEDMPTRGLQRGELGTVVEILSPDVFQVEFSDEDGRTYAMVALPGKLLSVSTSRKQLTKH